MKKLIPITLILIIISFIANAQKGPVHPQKVSRAIFHDQIGPIRNLPELTKKQFQEMAERKEDFERNEGLQFRSYPYAETALPKGPDGVWQKNMGSVKSITDIILNMDGQNSPYMPPDCNGAVGPDYYFQGVNTTFSIWDKEGNQVVNPTAYNTLFSGVPGASANDGDPIVLYDDLAGRWIAAEFSGVFSSPDYMMIAVSTTDDPTGVWNRWSFVMNGFPDYMKFGVWHDGYYMGTNTSFGTDIYVFERDVMLAGGSNPQMVSFDNPWRPVTIDGFHCIQPLDNDGNPAPDNAPGMFITMNDDAIGGGNDELWVYELAVDWDTPNNSTFDRVQQIPVAPFDSNFGNTWNNITQPSTGQKLDAIPNVLMYRAQYRNFGTSEAIVCCHTVDVDQTNHAGIRWYELERTDGLWSIRQQSTYAPDGHSRWMGSIAMNGNHEIALGYSISSSTEYPGIRIAGQSEGANANASGELDIEEQIIHSGTSSQTGTERWGDYSQMAVDPDNDHDFWYTNEYISGGQRKTKVCAFSFAPLLPNAIAGDDDSICSTDIYYGEGFAENYDSLLWSTSGDGFFVNDTALDPIYVRGENDIQNGNVTLTLTAYGFAPGLIASDDLVLNITKSPEVSAGNDTTIASDQFLLNGWAESYSAIMWSTAGDGAFDDPSVLDAVYTLGTEDMDNGGAELTLTAQPISPCGSEVSDNMMLNYSITGISDQSLPLGFNIIPNPSDGNFNLQFYVRETTENSLMVRDFTGKVIYINVFEATGSVNKSIDLSGLSKGIYLVELTSGNNLKTEKLIIK